MKRILAACLLLALAVGFSMWWFSDRQVVKRRTAALLDTVTIEAGAGKLARGLRSGDLDEFLAPRVRLEVPDEEASGDWLRDQVAAGFRFVAAQADFTRFERRDWQSVEVRGDDAVVVATVDAEVQVRRLVRVSGRYRTEFAWRRADGRWRIARVTMTPAGG